MRDSLNLFILRKTDFFVYYIRDSLILCAHKLSSIEVRLNLNHMISHRLTKALIH